MRSQEQVASKIPYGGRPISPVSLDRYEQLVLNVGKALGLGLVFAPALKTTQGKPEIQQLLEVLPG